MKLFNHIRFKMVEGKRLKNYLVYAIGEIILVVIGILIAVWINNWNKSNELAKSNAELQQKVLIQLDKDIAALDDFKVELNELNQIYFRTLGRDYDKSKIKNQNVFVTVLFQINVLRLDNHIVDWVTNAELDDSEISEQLIQLSSTYKDYLKYIEDTETIIYNKLVDNLQQIEATQDWYTALLKDSYCGDACVKYLLYNEEHKSRIASLRFLYSNRYGSNINNFYDDLLRRKASIEERISL